jgi:quercetin dioxygenase-like cupin family protein
VHHRDDETIYFLEGECTVTVGAHTMRALAGSFVHIPKGTVHAFANAGAGTARALLFLAPAGFEEAMEELAQLPPGPRDMTTVASILRKYHTEPVSMA